MQPGDDRTAANLLAVLTERHVLLLDVRRPAQALLQWPHGLGAARPQMLSLFCRASADEVIDLWATWNKCMKLHTGHGRHGPNVVLCMSAACLDDTADQSGCTLRRQVAAVVGADAAPLHGRVVAASLGTGDAVVLPFSLGPPAVRLVASPQELTAAAHRSRRREGTAQQGFRGQLALLPGLHKANGCALCLHASVIQHVSACACASEAAQCGGALSGSESKSCKLLDMQSMQRSTSACAAAQRLSSTRHPSGGRCSARLQLQMACHGGWQRPWACGRALLSLPLPGKMLLGALTLRRMVLRTACSQQQPLTPPWQRCTHLCPGPTCSMRTICRWPT
jgi:hypothetical protein